MLGYACLRIFTEWERELWHRATRMVELAPEIDETGELIRCHELARAVGRVLELEVCDGRFGFVEHSWLWLTESMYREDDGSFPKFAAPNVLDVYVPGVLPLVQLAHAASALPFPYAPAWTPRIDIRESTVDYLVSHF